MTLSSSFFVGGEPAALLEASSALDEAATRTDDVARRLAGALASAGTTIAACSLFVPARAAAVGSALLEIAASPTAGLAPVFAAYQALALQLRAAAQALEAAGAAGLLGTGAIGLLRGERPTVLASADGVDLRREALTATLGAGPLGHNSSLGVREVRRPDGSTFFVVEAVVTDKTADSLGVQINGVGGFVEAGGATETTLRWAVPTRRDAELLLAAASGALVLGGGRIFSALPRPTETVRATSAFAGLIGGPGPVAGAAPITASVNVRSEVTTLRSGGHRVAASLSGSGSAGLLAVAGTGAAGSVKVTVDHDRAGAVQRVSVSTSTEVDRGRHGIPILEAGNRRGTLVERTWDAGATPEARAAAARIAAAVARGDVPDGSDLDALAQGMRHAAPTERTYDTRHQQGSVDVAVRPLDGGAGAALDTATLRPVPPTGGTPRHR